jgi:hypothetical protein
LRHFLVDHRQSGFKQPQIISATKFSVMVQYVTVIT